MSRLYASGIGGTTGRQYDLQTISFGAYYLDDVYALAGEKMTEIMTDIFIDCLTSPVTENGVRQNLSSLKRRLLLTTSKRLSMISVLTQ